MAKRIHYYTDGSCLGNPGKGSWGVVSKCGTVELWGVEPDTTNNRMELTAIIGALVHARKNGVSASIYSDSELCIKCILGTYKKKANKDLWLTFDSLKDRGTRSNGSGATIKTNGTSKQTNCAVMRMF